MQSTPTSTQPLATAAPRLHPLVAGAAVAVIAVSALAGAAIVNSQVSARHTVESQVVAVAGAAAPSVDSAPPAAKPVAAPAAVTPNRVPARSEPRAASRPAPPPAASEPPPVAAPSAPAAAFPSAPVTVYPTAPTVAAAPVCTDCGTVLAVREVNTAGQGTGIGAVAGGVLGGVLGNQVGRGHGRDVARILGAVGGAVAGHHVEKQARASLRYEVDVQMDDGSVRTLSQDTAPTLRNGDAVRVDGNRLLQPDGRPVALRATTRPATGSDGGA